MTTADPGRAATASGLWYALAIGAGVSVAAGAYGSVHDPTGEQTISLFFSNTLSFKAWLTTLIAALALFQLWSALRMWDKVSWPRAQPAWLGEAHRLSGLLAFALSLPVAWHCLWALGFEPDIGEFRRFGHSLFGCFFYGAFAAKVTLVRSSKAPSWALPVAGGAVFTAVIALWLTSSLWFFTNIGFPEV